MNSGIKTVDDYLAQYDGETRKRLDTLRELIKKTIPKAIEDISYLMPAYRAEEGKRALVFFAASKDGVCTYALHFNASPDLLEQAKPYITTKSTMKFPNDKPLPLDLIKKLLVDKRDEFDLK